MNNVAQKVIQTDYYRVILPSSTTFEKTNSNNEELSEVDVYQIINSENLKTKYLAYLMVNKLNADITSISEFNFEDYLKDIGNFKIIETESIVRDNQKFYKLKLSLDNGIIGLVYISNMNEVLYRLFYMIPNEEYFTKYQKEISIMFKSADLLKSNWQTR
jgi:hypothetical protein